MIAAQAYSTQVKISLGLLLTVFLFLSILAFTSNGLYLTFCIAVLLTMLFLLWKFNRPGILVFALVMQWVQVVAFVLWMNAANKPLDYLSASAPYALVLSCTGLLVMALVISMGTRRLTVYTYDDIVNQARLLNTRKVLLLYVISTLFLDSIGFVFGITSGFAQILVTISNIKWIFFLVYGYLVWVNRKNKLIFLLILSYEFLSGLYSYFSTFKEVFFYAIILSLTFIRRITLRQFLIFIGGGFFLVILFLTWTAIKGEYRNFLSGGRREQVVTVSQSEAFSKIEEKVTVISWRDYQRAINLALYRTQYIYHLSVVMDRVPEMMPYEEGAVWWQNVTFVFTPRILFPEKPIYEATTKTNKYTGFQYAGAKKGASFSLGYFADGYVDFGYFGMFFPLIGIALFVLLIYRTFYKMTSLNLLFRFAIINAVLYNFASFEADGLFLFGRIVTNFLVFWTLSKLLFPSVQRWLYK